MSAIECWITDPAGLYISHLERSEASPFRNFRCSRILRADGAGSLEYALPNALLVERPTLLAKGNLVHMRFRGRTISWVVEDSTVSTDSQWQSVSGRGVRAMLGDRRVWPNATIDSSPTPKEWATQWRSFVNRAAGEMLWDLIDESNVRFATQFSRGHVGVAGDDGWTQKFRFDNLADIVADVEELFGDVDFDGLEFNYNSSGLGIDRTGDIVLEEGRDLDSASRDSSDRDTLTWVLAEGSGEGVFASTALGTNTGISARRREEFVAAKDVDSPSQLALAANLALKRGLPLDSISVELTEERYHVGEDFDLGDIVSVRAESRGIRDASRVVAVYYGEEGERVKVSIDINTRRQERLLRLDRRLRDTTRSLGVQNRQPQGQLVPFSFSGQGVFDTDDTLEVHLFIPDRMYVTIEARAAVDFRQFFAPAKSAASGGGATSGEENVHAHAFAHLGAAGGFTVRRYTGQNGGLGTDFDVAANTANPLWTNVGENHSHSTPNHTHGLTYGVFKEGYPASHSVTLKVYELVAGTWTLRTTISGLTGDQEDVDLTATITGPGQWMLTLQSEAAQPNGGRLGAYVSGFVLGAIQSS